MEASAIQVPSGLVRSRAALPGPSLLRLRSDEQLVILFRAGHEDAFRVIHDRYRQRLFAYTRQMLRGSGQDAEGALQDVFLRAYSGLRANDRSVALRAWLYGVAHNRCIDELRRPAPPAPELLELVSAPTQDPIVKSEQREALRRLIEDVGRLPEHQRSALLMREFSGMPYTELAVALGVSIPAVKSLLVRARISLAQSMQARDMACSEIREELTLAHDRGVRPNGMARRHLRDCASCRQFRGEVRGTSRQLAALVPALGPAGLLANLLGVGGGTSGGAAAGGGAAVTGAVGGGGSVVAAGGLLATGAGHVTTLLAAAAVAAGGAIEIQNTMTAPILKHRVHHAASASAAAEPTSPLAVPALRAAAPAPANYITSLPTPSFAAAGTPVHPVASPRRARDRTGPALAASGSGAPVAGPNPDGGSSLGAGAGDGAALLAGSVATPPGSGTGAVPGASTSDGSSTTAPASSASGAVTTSAAGASSGTGSATGAGPGTDGTGSGPNVPIPTGTASAGSGTTAATGPSGSAHPAAP